jgi:hypothetical protein
MRSSIARIGERPSGIHKSCADRTTRASRAVSFSFDDFAVHGDVAAHDDVAFDSDITAEVSGRVRPVAVSEEVTALDLALPSGVNRLKRSSHTRAVGRVHR